MVANAFEASSKISGRTSSPTRAPLASALRAARSTALRMASLASPQACVRVSATRGGAGASPSTRKSRPVIAAAAKATSATEAANRPAVSSDQEKYLIPVVGRSRNDGLIAATPQNDAGRMIDPPVWVPSAIGTMPAATAAAEPDDEPPGACAGLLGLRVLPGSRNANGVETVLPITKPPARRTIETMAASVAGRCPA